jgi:hypothetical protein
MLGHQENGIQDKTIENLKVKLSISKNGVNLAARNLTCFRAAYQIGEKIPYYIREDLVFVISITPDGLGVVEFSYQGDVDTHDLLNPVPKNLKVVLTFN